VFDVLFRDFCGCGEVFVKTDAKLMKRGGAGVTEPASQTFPLVKTFVLRGFLKEVTSVSSFP
jgi:hypothetical protein